MRPTHFRTRCLGRVVEAAHEREPGGSVRIGERDVKTRSVLRRATAVFHVERHCIAIFDDYAFQSVENGAGSDVRIKIRSVLFQLETELGASGLIGLSDVSIPIRYGGPGLTWIEFE